MKKVLVTGGAGFIGSAFVRLAVKVGYDVFVVDALTYAGDINRLSEVKESIKFYQVNLLDEDKLSFIYKEIRPDIVVHFAAETHVDRSILRPKDFFRTNVEGSLNLLELCRKHGIERFINVSTDEVYGEIREGKFREDSPLQPNSPYAVSKASQDMLGRAYYRTYGVPVITARPSNNYGPWQYPEKLIPVVILKAILNERIPIYGDGSNIREWLYVDDCAEAILIVMERGKVGETYNIGSNIEKRNIDVVREILKLLGKGEELIEFVKDRPGHDFRYSLDTEKIESELGFRAKTTFEEGIKKTVEWYLKHRDWLLNKYEEVKSLWKRVYQKI